MLSTFIFTVGNFVNHCSKLRSVKQTNRFKIFHLDLKLIFFSFPSVEIFYRRKSFLLFKIIQKYLNPSLSNRV